MQAQTKAQLTANTLIIPREMQDTLGLHEGSELSLSIQDGSLVVKPMGSDTLAPDPLTVKQRLAVIHRLHGIFAGSGLSEELEKMRAEEQEDENGKWNL